MQISTQGPGDKFPIIEVCSSFDVVVDKLLLLLIYFSLFYLLKAVRI